MWTKWSVICKANDINNVDALRCESKQYPSTKILCYLSPFSIFSSHQKWYNVLVYRSKYLQLVSGIVKNKTHKKITTNLLMGSFPKKEKTGNKRTIQVICSVFFPAFLKCFSKPSCMYAIKICQKERKRYLHGENRTKIGDSYSQWLIIYRHKNIIYHIPNSNTR